MNNAYEAWGKTVKELAIVIYTPDEDGLPPTWIGQSVLALDPSRKVALLHPDHWTERWCRETKTTFQSVRQAACPFEFGKCAFVEWDEETSQFRVNALREPFGPTVSEAPNFRFGNSTDHYVVWGKTVYTPDGVHVAYQLSEPIGDGTFFPMPVCEVTFPNLEEARAYMTEVVRNIDVDGLRLRGFAHL